MDGTFGCRSRPVDRPDGLLIDNGGLRSVNRPPPGVEIISAKLDVLSGVRTKCTAHWFLHVLTCSYIFLHVLTGLGSFYMFLNILGKKVVDRFLGYYSNM